MPKITPSPSLETLPNTSQVENEARERIELEALLNRAIIVQSQIDSVKELYSEMEEITKQLISRNFKSVLHEGKAVVLIDNFKDKNTCFRTTSVKRFELKIG